MPQSTRYQIGFAPETVDHLDAIDRKYHRLIAKTLDAQLVYSPERETRNRKPIEQPAPFDVTWELRFGPRNCFRAFYEVDNGTRTVWILAIGVKERNRLFVGGQEFEQ